MLAVLAGIFLVEVALGRGRCRRPHKLLTKENCLARVWANAVGLITRHIIGFVGPRYEKSKTEGRNEASWKASESTAKRLVDISVAVFGVVIGLLKLPGFRG